jgi:hypothetical protein
MRMERRLRAGILLTAMAVVAGQTGCSTMNNTEKGLGLGGLVGAGLGTAVGAAAGDPGTGALVGGLVGAGTGGIIGNAADREDRRRDVQQAVAVANAQAAQQRLGITDVVHMVQGGHDEQVIINQIRSSGSTFQLSPGDLDFLKANGVPPRVIVEMQNARAMPGEPVVVREPAVIYRDPGPVILVGPRWRPPPPPGFYFHWHNRGCW